MGGALLEHCEYDDGGQMLTASLMEYLCPTAVEAPQMTIEHHDSPSPFTVLGSKGVGENCAMSGPAAIASAVEAALRDYNATSRAVGLSGDDLVETLREADETGFLPLSGATQRGRTASPYSASMAPTHAVAGGQSLVPMMNFRVVSPAVIVDINHIKTLSFIKHASGGIDVGALTRQGMLEDSDPVRAELPIVTETMGYLAHRAVRNEAHRRQSCACLSERRIAAAFRRLGR